MENLQIQSCLKIYNKIISRPICSPFLCDDDGSIRYHRLKNKKICTIESIKDDLINKRISTYNDFFNRLIQFFESVRSNCKEDVPKLCAETMTQFIRKQMKKCSCHSSDQSKWIKGFTNTYSEFVTLIENAEAPFQELALRIKADPNEPLFLPFDPAEIQLLAEAIKKNEDDNVMKGVISIVQTLEPNYVRSSTGDFVCDLSTCQNQTLHVLRNYMLMQFNKNGISYPQYDEFNSL